MTKRVRRGLRGLTLAFLSIMVAGCGEPAERAVYTPPEANGLPLQDRQKVVELELSEVRERLLDFFSQSDWQLESIDSETGILLARIETDQPSTYVYGGGYIARGSDQEQGYMNFLETDHAPELSAAIEIEIRPSESGSTQVAVDTRYHLVLPGVTMFVEDLGEEVTFDDTNWIFRSGNFSKVQIQRPTGGAGPYRKVVATGHIERTILELF